MPLSLLLTTIHGCESTVTTRGLGVLTTHTNAPVVTETPVKAHTLHSLNVLRQARGKLSLSKDSLQCYSLECSQGFGKIRTFPASDKYHAAKHKS